MTFSIDASSTSGCTVNGSGKVTFSAPFGIVRHRREPGGEQHVRRRVRGPADRRRRRARPVALVHLDAAVTGERRRTGLLADGHVERRAGRHDRTRRAQLGLLAQRRGGDLRRRRHVRHRRLPGGHHDLPAGERAAEHPRREGCEQHHDHLDRAEGTACRQRLRARGDVEHRRPRPRLARLALDGLRHAARDRGVPGCWARA